MIHTANKNNLKLCVGLVRRFYKNSQFIKYLLDQKIYGNLTSFKISEGYVLDWPVQSDAIISKPKSGGGVLIDTGVHSLDLMLYWMGEYDTVDYYDDNMGGVESESYIHIKMKNGVTGKISYSRIRNLDNGYELHFEKAVVKVGINSNSPIYIELKNGKYKLQSILNEEEGSQRTVDAFKLQLENFFRAIKNGEELVADGNEGLKSVQVMEECYLNAKKLKEIYLHY